MRPLLKTAVPGPTSLRLARELRKSESRNITYISERFPIFWERAEGASVWDVDGNRFLDLTAGFGVAALGFGAPVLVAALRDQAGMLYHAMGDVHPTALKVDLCRELSRLTFEAWGAGPGKTILTNSGSEAVEAALKTAALASERRGVLAFRGGDHGLGYGALTVTGHDYFRAPFQPQLADFAAFAPFPKPEADPAGTERELVRLLEGRENPIGAILVEPIQGRGGKNIPPGWFLPLLRRLADAFGVVLIFDEIFTGLWRTGRRFACDWDGVVPDLLCLGKALTGGFPLAACVGRAGVMDAWPESQGEALHTSTFLGNPLGCRMALASLSELEKPGVGAMVLEKGERLFGVLRELASETPGFQKPRGRGLMAGVDVVDGRGRPDSARAGGIVEGMLAEGVIQLSDGMDRNVATFTPPFVIETEDLLWAAGRLARWAAG